MQTIRIYLLNRIYTCIVNTKDMDRRTFVQKGTAIVTTISLTGATGCSKLANNNPVTNDSTSRDLCTSEYGSSNPINSCSTQPSSVSEALLDTDNLTLVEKQSIGINNSINDVIAGYAVPGVTNDSEFQFAFQVVEFPSADTADTEVQRINSADQAVHQGYTLTQNYAYIGMGYNVPRNDILREDVITYMKTSPMLNDCIKDSITFSDANYESERCTTKPTADFDIKSEDDGDNTVTIIRSAGDPVFAGNTFIKTDALQFPDSSENEIRVADFEGWYADQVLDLGVPITVPVNKTEDVELSIVWKDGNGESMTLKST